LFFGPWLFRAVFAGARSAATGEPFQETMGNMPLLSSRLVTKNTEGDGSGLEYYAVEIKGLLPVYVSSEVSVAISLFDETEGAENLRPILSFVEQFQEPLTTAYFQRADLGRIDPDQGFKKWIEIGRILPLFVQSPFSGKRKICAVVRLINSRDGDKIHLGYWNGENTRKILWAGENHVEIDQIAKGYEEAVIEKNETLILSVQLAMSIAMADGSLDDSEGTVIKEWMQKVITSMSEARQIEMKEKLNSTMRATYESLKASKYSNSAVVERFNEIGDGSMKFEAMELCYDTMAADGRADPEEMKILHRLGEALELDLNELEKIRDM
jgi:tellurite resistance protein